MPNTSSKATVSSKKPNSSMAQQKGSQNNHPVNQNKNQPNTKAKAGPEQLTSKDSSIETKPTGSASQVNNKTGNQAVPAHPITSPRDRKQQWKTQQKSSQEKEAKPKQEESFSPPSLNWKRKTHTRKRIREILVKTRSGGPNMTLLGLKLIYRTSPRFKK